MDANRFDSLTRELSDIAARRTVIGAALAGVLGTLGPDPTEAKKKKACPSCKKRKKGKCKKKRPDGTACPGGVCQGGRCSLTCVPDCVDRVCGPNSCGTGSCGDCGDCTNCEGGACVNKPNASPCGGTCQECQDGTCVPKANGTDCGGNRACQGGACGCAPSNRICGDSCCPTGQICVDPDTEQCVDAQGTCAAGGNFCVDGASKCGLGNCFCYQTFAGETRCGNQAVGSGTCTCTNDAGCSSFGIGAFCVQDAGTGFCAGCPATVGFCATRCQF